MTFTPFLPKYHIRAIYLYLSMRVRTVISTTLGSSTFFTVFSQEKSPKYMTNIARHNTYILVNSFKLYFLEEVAKICDNNCSSSHA